MIEFFSLGVMVLIASLCIFVVVHELTHLALSDEPHGFCIGYCGTNHQDSLTYLGMAYGEPNELSKREDIPNVAGGLAALASFAAGLFCLHKLYNGGTA